MSFKPFSRLSKGRSMKRFSAFDGRASDEKTQPVAAEKAEEVETRSDRESALARELGDEQWARRIFRLLEKNPNGTVIEMLAMDWLDKNLADYVYQARVAGGYREGGIVPDFVVRNRGEEWVALLINGNYWHNVPGTQNDTGDKLSLVGQYFLGARIKSAVIVWESRLMRGKQAVDEVMNAALQSTELGM